MHRLKAVVQYDGTHYGGWQKQLNTHSIQDEIEGALAKLHGHEVSACASGRTDAFVHALGQVFHFDSTKDMEEEAYKRALNSLLPRDIRIQSITKVSNEFHARFDAIRKRYDYLITSEVANPFYEHYMGKDRKLLDVEYMKTCSELFLGVHDFTSFTSNKIDPRKSRIKEVIRLDVLQEEHNVRMIFEGSGFLRYMVRMLAQTLIEAGKHHITKEEIKDMLEAKDKHVCRYKAQAQGLYLVNVWYKED